MQIFIVFTLKRYGALGSTSMKKIDAFMLIIGTTLDAEHNLSNTPKRCAQRGKTNQQLQIMKMGAQTATIATRAMAERNPYIT